jgi:lipopolysaccharide export system ATP-binding protein
MTSNAGERGLAELVADGLVKAYRGRNVVDGVSLLVRQGEIVGLLGPNGAGKTTTFYMMVGLVRPGSGRVLLNGEDITRLPVYRRARLGIAYLSQEPSAFRRLTVAQNIQLVLEMRGLPEPARQQKQEQLLRELGIANLRHQVVQALSGGERRRVEVARTLAADPTFVLLDEPFTGVDPIAAEEIRSLVLGLKLRNIGVLITDHNVRDTLAITDRAYIMHSGRILTAGIAEDLVNDRQARELYLGRHFEL